MPKVSVIIPSYNRAHLIGRAIRSVLNQTYQDYEIIVVDDASTDNTEEVVGIFSDQRIKYIRHESNKGAGAARNTGIQAATGEFIAFQDSDDEWFPEKLERQMKVFDISSPEVGVVYTDMKRIKRDGEIRYLHPPTITCGDLIGPRGLDYQVKRIGIQSTLIRKECFNKVGLFDEELPRLIDLELLIRLSKVYHFHHIKEPLVQYYATEGITSNDIALVTARKLLLERYSEDINKNKRFLANQYFLIGVTLCSCGDLGQGRSYFMKAVVAYPLDIKPILLAFISLFGQGAYNKAIESYRKIRDQWSRG